MVMCVALAQVKPDLERQVQDFKRKHFRQVTIGMQIRCATRFWLSSSHLEHFVDVKNLFVPVAFSAGVQSEGADDDP